jgi:hypothetical protein
MPRPQAPGDFDGYALFAALDERRSARSLSWAAVAREVWEQSAVLNGQRPADHPISPGTFANLGRNGDCSCQHALFFLRWLDAAPEDFVPGAEVSERLPTMGSDRRPRWDLRATYAALDARRTERGLTWARAAAELHCTPSQLTGLRTASYATSMRLAMRISRWLGRPAADFVYAGRW